MNKMDESKVEYLNLQLIDSTNYKEFIPVFVVLFFGSYFFSFFNFPSEVILVLVSINIMVPLTMYIYTKYFITKGRLQIDQNYISIDSTSKDPLIFPILHVTNLKITRGATLHKDNGIYPADLNDNWISFNFNNRSYRYEFGIVSSDENLKFEAMMKTLRKKYSNFIFLSI